MNQDILYFFNNMAHTSAALDSIAKFLIQDSALIILIVIVVVYLAGILAKKELFRTTAFNAACTVVVCLIVGFVIGHFVQETRPMFALNDVTVLLPHANDSSFPSDHMLFCFAAAFGFYQLSRKFGVILMVFGLLVGIAKIYAAQHYPLDILLTIILTFVISFLYLTFISKWPLKIYSAVERRIMPFLHDDYRNDAK